MDVKLVLYSLNACPGCQVVRNKLADLELTYVCVNVSRDKSKRQQVMEVSGQPFVPVLVDDGQVFASEEEIVKHLDQTYGKA